MATEAEKIEQRQPYRKEGEYGFTNDVNRLRGAEQFRDDAAADGWLKEPTYGHESVDRASRLTRDGFVIQVLTRDNSAEGRGKKFEAAVHMWGPDDLAVDPPEFYDFAEIKRRTRICSACKAEDVETQRYSFAGRCCEACLPKMRAATEYPGWCD
jgi:hypothetical protein